jgi:hypothetical protein
MLVRIRIETKTNPKRQKIRSPLGIFRIILEKLYFLVARAELDILLGGSEALSPMFLNRKLLACVSYQDLLNLDPNPDQGFL